MPRLVCALLSSCEVCVGKIPVYLPEGCGAFKARRDVFQVSNHPIWIHLGEGIPHPSRARVEIRHN